MVFTRAAAVLVSQQIVGMGERKGARRRGTLGTLNDFLVGCIPNSPGQHAVDGRVKRVREDDEGSVHVDFMDPASVMSLVDNPGVVPLAAEVKEKLARACEAL